MTDPRMVLVLFASITMTGCAESTTVIGNGVSMVVACVLLWSTVNLDQQSPAEDE